MKTNEALQKDVQDAIKWEPVLSAAEIGVTAKDGIVTLTGTVDSYRKKSEAEDAAKNVAGVKAVVEKIEIASSSIGIKTDSEIAAEVINAFKWNWEIPNAMIKVKVEGGWVTLDGELEWNYQRNAANKSVSTLDGVKGIANNLTIRSATHDQVEQKDIQCALGRNWSTNDADILVNVSGNSVTLNGIVHSFYQKDEASRIAWNAPGVRGVNNELVIEYGD
jgi:osmotically-inducible protein OsmY